MTENKQQLWHCAACDYSTNNATTLRTHIKGFHKFTMDEYNERYGDTIELEKTRRKELKFIDTLCAAKFKNTESITADEDTEENRAKMLLIYRHGFAKNNNKALKESRREFIIRIVKYFNELSVEESIHRYDKMDEYKGKQGESVEYLTLMFGEKLASEKLKIKSERVAGENNPGFEHGGKFSKLSKNYIHYDGEESRKEAIKNVSANRVNYNTRLDYYTNQGMSLEEAEEALYERQRVGALDKFIERYGEEEGTIRWKERQVKWQNTLDNKTDDEKRRINMSKRPKNSFMYREFMDENQEAHLYFVKLRCTLTDTVFYKIGATTKLNTRHRFQYNKYDIEILDILAESTRCKVGFIGEKETKIHNFLKDKIGIFDLGRTFDGWTECYALSENQVKNVKKSISKIGLN